MYIHMYIHKYIYILREPLRVLGTSSDDLRRLLGSPCKVPENPKGPWEVLGDLWGLPRALLETSDFTFQGGEFVDGITKYGHSRFGHDFGQRPESVQ